VKRYIIISQFGVLKKSRLRFGGCLTVKN